MTKAEQTREQIIEAAAAAIRSLGPVRVTVAVIMSRLKLTHGGFYAHFASKDELIQLALEAAFDDISRRANQVIADKGPADALAACIDWYVSDEMRDHPERACPLTVLSHDSSGLPDAAQARLSEGALRMANLMERLLRAVGRPDAKMESLSVAAEMVGAVSLARAVVDRERSGLFLASTRAALKSRLGLV